jgi:hypothetical protein
MPHAVFNCCPSQTLPLAQHPVGQVLELQIPPSGTPAPMVLPPSSPEELVPPDEELPPPGAGFLLPVVSTAGRVGDVDEHAPTTPAHSSNPPATKVTTFMP